MMGRHRDQNVERILVVAHQLGELAKEVIFTGGAAAGLLITDPAVPDIRATIDIDVIVEIVTRTDYMARHDMEDWIAVLNGCLEIVEDILTADEKIKTYIADQFRKLLGNDEFLDAMPGHLPPDQASQERILVIEERMRRIIEVQ